MSIALEHASPGREIDASELQPAYRGGPKRLSTPATVILGALIPVVAIALWWIEVSRGQLNETVFSSPGRIATTFWGLVRDGELFVHLGASLGRALVGLAAGLLIGLVAGAISGLSRVGAALLDPLAQVLRTIPVLAILPLFIVFFGLTELPKIAIIAFAVAPPVYINTYNGIRFVDKKLLETAQAFDLTRVQTAFQVVLPAALPSVFNGVRIAVSLSLLLLVAAESVNSTIGLGQLANQGLQYFRTDLIYSVVIVYGVLGLLGDVLVRLIERVSIPWLGKQGIR